MKKKIQMSLDDIVFEHRNKAYGAYALRQEYKANLTKAAVIGSLSMITVFLSSFVANKINPKEPKEIICYYPIVELEDIGLVTPDIPDEPIEPEITKAKEEVVKQIQNPPQVTPVQNNEPEDGKGLPTEEELKISAIGNETIDGPPVEGSFANPGPIEIPGDVIAPEPPAPPALKVDEPMVISEVMPEFEGGMSKMYKWLSKNLKYPDNASRNGIEGRVVVSFIVEKNGGISDVKILKGIGFGCDEEAERVVKAMPKWKAGIQNGRPVRVKYTLPLTFKINS